MSRLDDRAALRSDGDDCSKPDYSLTSARNGPIEDLHAGKCSPLLEDKALSRITDAEMKTLMIAVSTKLADLLALRDEDPEAFAALLAGNWRQAQNWER